MWRSEASYAEAGNVRGLVREKSLSEFMRMNVVGGLRAVYCAFCSKSCGGCAAYVEVGSVEARRSAFRFGCG
jgi:hypothetical protein